MMLGYCGDGSRLIFGQLLCFGSWLSIASPHHHPAFIISTQGQEEASCQEEPFLQSALKRKKYTLAVQAATISLHSRGTFLKDQRPHGWCSADDHFQVIVLAIAPSTYLLCAYRVDWLEATLIF
jgi:hypothetical protein